MLKKWLQDSKNKDLIIIAVLILLNILPRLIYILNNGFFLDGDEAILGTVIQDVAANHHFSVFLSGQNYGFVFLEVLLGSLVSLFLGANLLSLKITIFIFWLADIVVLYYIGKKIFKNWQPAALAVLLISFIPVWYDWATKARFGYVSALLLANIVILLTLLKKSNWRLIIISLLLLFIFYVQPLYLVVVAPFLAYYFFKDFKLKDSVIFTAISSGLLAGSYFFLSHLGFQYQLQNRLGFSEIIRNLKTWPSFYAVAYSGRFFDSMRLDDVSLASWTSYIFLSLLLIVIVYDFYLLARRKIRKNTILFLSAAGLYIFFMLFYDLTEYHYRYLLPFFIPSIFLIILAGNELSNKKLKKYLFIFLIIYAGVSLISGIRSYNYIFPRLTDGESEVGRIEILGGFLQTNDIKCVYALDWIISQHLDYFLPGVTVRHQEIDPRRPQDSKLADAYEAANQCALVGLWYQMPSFTPLYKLDDIYVVSNRYLVHLRPTRADLLRLNFQLTD